MTTRKAIPKSVRFEVLKRDSFTCQYCGAQAPAVLLHIDHIDPVAGGGSDEITNLITSCAPCNLGKSDRKLSDDAAVTKAKSQMDELQERREQLELMMQWKRGLDDLEEETVESVAAYYSERVPGFFVKESGLPKLKRLTNQFSVQEVIDAIGAAADAYLEIDQNGKPTYESAAKILDSVGGICRVKRASKTDPILQDLFYIRGIMRKRFSWFSHSMHSSCIDLLRQAVEDGVSIAQLRLLAVRATSWTAFWNWVEREIQEAE